jgi:hypothetical protein
MNQIQPLDQLNSINFQAYDTVSILVEKEFLQYMARRAALDGSEALEPSIQIQNLPSFRDFKRTSYGVPKKDYSQEPGSYGLAVTYQKKDHLGSNIQIVFEMQDGLPVMKLPLGALLGS